MTPKQLEQTESEPGSFQAEKIVFWYKKTADLYGVGCFYYLLLAQTVANFAEEQNIFRSRGWGSWSLFFWTL